MNRLRPVAVFLSLGALVALGYTAFGSEGAQAEASAGFKFANITHQAGFVSLRNLGGHGVQAADVTGDGLDDIYVTNIADPHQDRRELFFVNRGDATFREQAIEAGIEDDGFFAGEGEESHAAAFADIDNDGDLRRR